MSFSWEHASKKKSHSFTCGYCGSYIASDLGYRGVRSPFAVDIYICHVCSGPTYFDLQHRQTPGAIFGNAVAHTDSSVGALYDEARSAYSANSFTAVVLCCRKLLMHVAVSKGAKVGESFASYVQYLADQNFVPPDAKGWVDHIRTKGNEANHEIAIMKAEDASELLEFSEMLLKLVYEYPATMAKKYPPKP